MPTAAVIYCSDTWTTAGLADEIADHLRSRGVEATVASFDECDEASLAHVDYLLLGCWTSGLFVVGQHPVDTTYKILTGSMFRRMRRELRNVAPRIELELKSRNRHLTEDGRRALDRFIGAA